MAFRAILGIFFAGRGVCSLQPRKESRISLLLRNMICYARAVIRTFRHGGIEKFFRTGSKAGIQPKHEGRLRILLTTLNLASTPLDMNRSGWDWHPLKGDLKGALVRERKRQLAADLHL